MLAVGAASTWFLPLIQRAEAHAQALRGRKAGAPAPPGPFTAAERELVRLAADLILPQTEVAGALAAGVPEFIETLVGESDTSMQQTFSAGLAAIQAYSQERCQKGFGAASAEERLALLEALDARTVQLTQRIAVAPQYGPYFVALRVLDADAMAPGERARVEQYQALKSLTLAGFCSSEVGERVLGIEQAHLFHAQYGGCTHPEHGGGERR